MLRKATISMFTGVAYALLGAVHMLVPAAVNAETLIVEGIETPAAAPAPGTQKSAVEASLGAPRARTQPVGDPPISSWEYAGFVVFFEYDRVIHSVAKR